MCIITCGDAEYAALCQSSEQLWAQQQQLEKARYYLRLLLIDLPATITAGLLPEVQQFLHLVEAKLATAVPTLALEPYAEVLCITTKHLSDLCRQATGKSATDLLKEKVATAAKVLLTGT